MAFGFGEVISTVVVIKMVVTPFWNEYQKGQAAILKILQRSQMESVKNLSQALGELVARGKNKGIDSHELYRNLEKLLSLLCLDASHRRINWQLRHEIRRLSIRWKRHDLRDQEAKIEWFLLLDPECAEVFEATKVNMGTVTVTSQLNRLTSELSEWGWRWQNKSLPTATARRAVALVFRKSVEDLFNRATEIHATQRAFAAALCEHDSLCNSYEVTDSAGRAGVKSREAAELRDKLLRLRELPPALYGIWGGLAPNDADFDYPVAEAEWSRGPYPQLLLVDRFGLSRAEGREREIAALFDAVGATDAQRGDIESHINSLYGTVRRRWLADGWIKTARSDSRYGWNDYSPFFDFRFRGWRKAKSKRRVLFLEHYDLFQLKSPRQLTEEGVLGLVQTMEAHEDTVFVRESRLNSELQQIYNRAVENECHGKFKEAIADLKVLLRRVSERADIYPVEILSRIRSYLACIYASRGENLEEAVELARGTLEIQDVPPFTRLALGWSYHRQGKVVAAIEELEVAKSAAIRAGSGLLPLVHLVLGDAYRDAERHQDAQKAWRAGWQFADDPAWKKQARLTPFEVAERVRIRGDLGERLGMEEAASNTRAKRAKAASKRSSEAASRGED